MSTLRQRFVSIALSMALGISGLTGCALFEPAPDDPLRQNVGFHPQKARDDETRRAAAKDPFLANGQQADVQQTGGQQPGNWTRSP